MRKLKNGEVYVGETLSRTYIGRYNEDSETLDNVYGIIVNKDNIQIIPCAHPAFLTKKFTNALIEIPIDIDKFLFVNEVDELSIGNDLKNIYVEQTSGIVTKSDEQQLEQEITKDSKIILN